MRLGKPTMRFHVFPRSWQGYQDSCHWVNTTFRPTGNKKPIFEKYFFPEIFVGKQFHSAEKGALSRKTFFQVENIYESERFIRVHRQAKFAQSTILCFQYLGFHGHAFNRVKLANYVIVPDSTDSSNKCLALRIVSIFVSRIPRQTAK